MRSFLATFAMLSALASAASAAESSSPLGRKVENFTLRDFRGKLHSLDEAGDKKLVVIAFLGCDCPLARLYAPRLEKLAQEYEPKGVTFLGINANSQDSLTELGAYVQSHGLTFPVLKDAGNAVADQVGAIRTPEVFVLDQDRIIRYRGRIDDQYLVGRQRPPATQEDLTAALEDLLAGQPVSTAETAAVGCHI